MEVGEGSNLEAPEAHVRQELRVVNVVQLVDAPGLDHDLSFDDDVRHGERPLPLEGESTETEFAGGGSAERAAPMILSAGSPASTPSPCLRACALKRYGAQAWLRGERLPPRFFACGRARGR